MINLQEIISNNNLTITDVARIMGKERSTISKIVSGNYPNLKENQKEVLEALRGEGYPVPTFDEKEITLNRNLFLSTMNVQKFFDLLNGLLDSGSTMNSSLGCVTGTAGRGKTFASREYCESTENAYYILYVDGFSKVMLIKTICEAITGTSQRTFDRCLQEIKNACTQERRLVIIDEADKMHRSYLEMLRAVNEFCQLPIVLVGEDRLYYNLSSSPRLKSRIRNPHINFESVSPTDVMIYYKEACGIQAEAKAINLLHTKARGDFRTVANDANAIVQAMNASGVKTLTEELAKSIY